MRILDRYIAKLFAVSYLFTFLSVLGFYFVIDMVSNIDEFIKNRSFVETMILMGQFYLYQMPIIFLNVSPIITLMAAMFTLVRLIKHNEHIPMFASGISMRRAVAPIFILSIAATGLIVLMQEVVVPNNAVKIADLKQLKRKNKQWIMGYVSGDSTNNLTIVSEFHVDKEAIRRHNKADGDVPTVWVLFRDENFREQRLLQAYRALWERNDQGHKCWHFYNYKIWTFDEEGLLKAEIPETGDVYIADKESLTMRPEDIRETRDENMYLSTMEIIRRWRRDPQYIRLGVLANSRLAFPVLNMVLLLVGIPFVLMGETDNAFRGAGRTLTISALFFMVVFVAQDLGNKGQLSPFLSAWLPVALFGALGIMLWDHIRT